MEENSDYDDTQKYLIDVNKQWFWRHPNDTSVAYHKERKPDNFKPRKSGYDVFEWDSQFLRYSQIIDTDYKNYIVLYSCYEIAEFYHKEGAKHIKHEKVFKKSEARSLAMPPNHVPVEFTLSKEDAKNIHTLNLFKHKVVILWKPDFNDAGEWYYNQKTVNETMLAELLDVVDERFPKLRYKETNRFNRVIHSRACDYDPYEETLEHIRERMSKKSLAERKAKKAKEKKLKKEKEQAKKRQEEEEAKKLQEELEEKREEEERLRREAQARVDAEEAEEFAQLERELAEARAARESGGDL